MRDVVFYFTSNTNACYRIHFQHELIRFAGAHGWRLLPVEPLPHAVLRRRIPQLIRDYSPVGAITSFHEVLEDAWPRTLPIVWVDTEPRTKHPRSANVRADNAAIGRLAAEEFLRDRESRTFACLSLAGITWARDRSRAFAQTLKDGGIQALTREIDVPNANFPPSMRIIQKTLENLPRPLGVFAVNDRMAYQVLFAAESLGLRIPEDLSLVGVDNDEALCLAGPTAITSIQPDWNGCGRLAGEALESLLLDAKAHPCLQYGPITLIRRASTVKKARQQANSRVERALGFIREHAASPDITVEDVIASMGCSRRLGELRFREVTGRSILAELHDRRLDLVKAQLNRKMNTTLVALANRCGFRSSSALRAFFRAQTGMSMRDWIHQGATG